MTSRLRPRRGRRFHLPALAVLAAALLAPASAPAATVTGGHLDWSIANVYESSAPANTNRTWLGYVSGPPPALAAGTATPSDGAGGDTVTPASPRGASALAGFSFPAAGGSYDHATAAGTVELKGTLTFASSAHGFTISVTDPQLVLAGATGRIFASGQGSTSQGPTTYDRSAPLYDLDLGAASVTDWPDGSRTIAGIVPRLATADYAFPSNYGAGAGPERTPNTFGAFAVTLSFAPAAAPGTGSDPGPSPQTGASTPTKVAVAKLTGRVQGGAKARKRVTVTLSRAPATNAARTYKVKLISRGQVIATGTLRGRKLTLNVRKGRVAYHRIKGAFTLRPASSRAKLAATTVTIG